MIVYARRCGRPSEERTLVPVTVDDDYAHVGAMSITTSGYPQITDPKTRRTVLLHRWLLGFATGDGRIGDHINGVKTDARRVNLREVTIRENGANVTAHRGRPFRLRGVYRCPDGRYRTRAVVGGRRFEIGVYETPEEASRAVAAWRQENMPGYIERS